MKSDKTPFIIYVNLESLIENVQTNEKNLQQQK